MLHLDNVQYFWHSFRSALSLDTFSLTLCDDSMTLYDRTRRMSNYVNLSNQDLFSGITLLATLSACWKE